MSAVFFKLMLWPCMFGAPHGECAPQWLKTYSNVEICQIEAVKASEAHNGQVTACVPYRVKLNKEGPP